MPEPIQASRSDAVTFVEMLSAGPIGYDRYITSSGHTEPWPAVGLLAENGWPPFSIVSNGTVLLGIKWTPS